MAQKRDLRVFMRESAKTEEIVTVPGPDSIKDEDGKPIMLEIKVLSNETIQKINDNYKKIILSMNPGMDSSYEGIKSTHMIDWLLEG